MRRSKTYILSLFISILFWSSYKHKDKVFVIGDSISIYYGTYLEKDLSRKFIYDRKGGKEAKMANPDIPEGANGGDSNRVVKYLESLKSDENFTTDYFLINCGLHDIKHNTITAPSQVNLETYKVNLEKIIAITRQMNAKLIWINTTPVVDSIHNKKVPFFRYNDEVIKYNTTTDSLMKSEKIPIIDLYTFTQKFVPEGYMDHVHFNKKARKKQADFIAKQVKEITKEY